MSCFPVRAAMLCGSFACSSGGPVCSRVSAVVGAASCQNIRANSSFVSMYSMSRSLSPGAHVTRFLGFTGGFALLSTFSDPRFFSRLLRFSFGRGPAVCSTRSFPCIPTGAFRSTSNFFGAGISSSWSLPLFNDAAGAIFFFGAGGLPNSSSSLSALAFLTAGVLSGSEGDDGRGRFCLASVVLAFSLQRKPETAKLRTRHLTVQVASRRCI
mmetsp:Transcript_1382/g.4094  ORF Transcript_1382/g.4094 Transcript_1382/m.4094 type:complete len:212 (-) Transcript_1382:2110-2745(-)